MNRIFVRENSERLDVYKKKQKNPKIKMRSLHKKLQKRLRCAGVEDFEIYTVFSRTDAARRVTSEETRLSLFTRVILPVMNGDLEDRTATSDEARLCFDRIRLGATGDERIQPKNGWVQALLVNNGNTVPFLVCFFLPRLETELPELVTTRGVENRSGVITSSSMIICVIDYVNRACSDRVHDASDAVVWLLANRDPLPCVCGFCGIVTDEWLERCGACRKVFYCTKECQKRDWAEHKRVCV